LRSPAPSVVSLIVPEGAHHLDLRAADPRDPPSVTKVRRIEAKYIAKWIREANEKDAEMPTGPDAGSVVVGRTVI